MEKKPEKRRHKNPSTYCRFQGIFISTFGLQKIQFNVLLTFERIGQEVKRRYKNRVFDAAQAGHQGSFLVPDANLLGQRP